MLKRTKLGLTKKMTCTRHRLCFTQLSLSSSNLHELLTGPYTEPTADSCDIGLRQAANLAIGDLTAGDTQHARRSPGREQKGQAASWINDEKG